MMYYGLLLFFFVEYIRPGSFLPGFDVLHLNAVLPLTVVAGTFIKRTKFPNAAVFGDLNGKVLLSLLGLLVVSLATASVTEYAFDTLSDATGYLLIAWVISHQANDPDRIRGVMMSLLCVHLVIAAMNPVLFTDPEGRNYIFAGPFLGDGNDFALSLNVALPFCVYLLFESRKWYQKMFWCGGLLLLVMCIVLTKSRGGTIALVAVGLYYWIKSNRKVRMAALVAVVVAIVLAMAPASYFSRLSQIADTQEGSAEGRILAWTAATQMAMSNPLFGVGAGNFATSYGAFYKTRDDVPWQTAHSVYFLALGELGVPGLMVVLAFVFGNLAANRKLFKELRQRPSTTASEINLVVAMSASVLAFAAGGAFLSALYYPHMYMIAGLNTATRLVMRERMASLGVLASAASPLAAPVRPPLRPGAISPEWKPTHGLQRSVERSLR
jgi:probable O-glycosylation ligase (exosortase A-associated)